MKNFEFFDIELRCLDDYCVFLKKTAYILWGEAVREYFFQNKERLFFINQVKSSYNRIYDFIFTFVNKVYLILQNQFKFANYDEEKIVY
jgi:hypothetical protein